MKDNEIPGHLPKINDAPNGYKWVYRGLGWRGYNVTYAAICIGESNWYYSRTSQNTNALRGYHYVKLEKISSLEHIKSASLVEQIEIAKDIVKSVKMIKYNLLEKDVRCATSYFDKVEVAVDYESAKNYSALVAEAYIDTNKPVVVLTTRNGPPCISLFDIYQKPEHVEVKLNSQYNAIVTSDTIQVGCQKFPISILKDLQDAHKSL